MTKDTISIKKAGSQSSIPFNVTTVDAEEEDGELLAKQFKFEYESPISAGSLNLTVDERILSYADNSMEESCSFTKEIVAAIDGLDVSVPENITCNETVSVPVSIISEGRHQDYSIKCTSSSSDIAEVLSVSNIDDQGNATIKLFTKLPGAVKLNISVEGTHVEKQVDLFIDMDVNDVQPEFSIALDKDAITMRKGESQVIKATVTPENTEQTVSWTSDNESVATVDSTGKIVAVSKGTATITAAVVNETHITASCKVTVEPLLIEKVTINGVVDKVYTGNAVEQTIEIRDGDGILTEGTDYTVSYENNNSAGTATVMITGIGNYTGTVTKTFMILPGKTTRGDMFNLANNVKVTWKEVPGAAYYKVYREGISNPGESRKDPVIVTTGLVGWDKEPGLTNGHSYRYKIVASLTGKGNSSGDSPLSYSKLMYRLKTVVIRSAKNTAPGKVTVKYDKTATGDSYVLQYCDRQDMVGAKTKVVLGANNTSYVIGGLKKGKTYYISIRVRKKVNGIDYYTTFGVPKKVTIIK